MDRRKVISIILAKIYSKTAYFNYKSQAHLSLIGNQCLKQVNICSFKNVCQLGKKHS